MTNKKELACSCNHFMVNMSLLRISKRLTLEQMQERTGISQKTLSKYETGVCEPGVTNLLMISISLGVTLDELVRKKVVLETKFE